MWHTIRRESSLVEHICTHHVGHPNFYSVARLHRYEFEFEGRECEDHALEACSWFIHGCDGCCGREDFPGLQMTDQQIVLRLHRKIENYLEGDFDDDRLREWCAYTIHDMNVNQLVRKG